MSEISQAYDAILSLVETTFPDHEELINAYAPELNDDLTFDAAFGVSVAEGENTNRVVGCDISQERRWLITLCRKIMAGTLNRSTVTKTVRRTAEKNLLEDLDLLVAELEKSPTINNSAPIVKTVYESDSGLEFIRTERQDLIMIRAVFRTEYFRNIP